MTGNDYSANELSAFLQKWNENNETDVSDEIIQFAYHELRRQAHNYLRNERAGHTLQTTALVHEAYLKLKQQKNIRWESRSHFLGIAATLMRRILIDYAKTKHRVKRGGVKDNLKLDEALTIAVSQTDCDLLALDEVLERLAEKDPYLAKVVELRFFSGLDLKETAEVLNVSESTVKRDWVMAKSWLKRELTR